MRDFTEMILRTRHQLNSLEKRRASPTLIAHPSRVRNLLQFVVGGVVATGDTAEI